MPRLLPMAVLAASLLWITHSGHAAHPALARAKSLLERHDDRAALQTLEDALLSASAGDRPTLIESLKTAYETAAQHADVAGKARDAREFRENLQLLKRNDKSLAPSKKADKSKLKPAESVETQSAETPDPKPITPIPELRQELLDPQPEPIRSPDDRPEPLVRETPSTTPTPPPVVPHSAEPDEARTELARGDRAWKDKRYLEAGAIYTDLARTKTLPASRNDLWAYCRLVKVMEVINAGPTTPTQWNQVHAEIDRIKLLSPSNWYAEYLRSVVNERSGMARRPASNKTILRGASPDDPPSAPKSTVAPSKKKSPGALRPTSPAPTTATEPSAREEAEVGRPGPMWGTWQTFDTPNFRIIHADETLARKVANRAEAARADLVQRWSGHPARGAWTPRCDLYLYPTASQFSVETGQPEESPGFSTAELSGGRVSMRLIRLRGDHPRMVDAVLPHEITHVVLAELFPIRQIPRWADEGMAVLSEPGNEQNLRAADLHGPLTANGVFKLIDLMTTDYPADPYRALFYAQSISVTRFLVQLGTPTQFVTFVGDSQTLGIEPALRKHYQIESYTELDQQWRQFARSNLPETASATSKTPTRR